MKTEDREDLAVSSMLFQDLPLQLRKNEQWIAHGAPSNGNVTQTPRNTD